MSDTLSTRTISDAELWPCESCGVRGLTTERVMTCSGTDGLIWPLGTMRICDRCYNLHPHIFLFCAYFHLKYGRPVPQLEEWLAKQAEPQFDPLRHVLRRRGLVSETEPGKMIVQVGGSHRE